MIFQRFSQNKKEKKNRKTDAISPSNRSGRICKRFCEYEEAGRTILWFREEKQIRLKVEGVKKDFFPPVYSLQIGLPPWAILATTQLFPATTRGGKGPNILN